ncbi:MAG TPA: TRAP transporter large permease subunit [Candidatus Methylomirabilis sp.]|nr:TRAP transporter large permease subunit [Candidatus Methylomirabilis sp.]
MTPPFGMVLFVLQRVGDLPFDRLVRALVPFLVPLGAVLLLTIVFPQSVTWLPRALMR